MSLFITPALAQRDLRDIPDPDPAKELAALKVLDGFEINLFAAEPMLVDPIHMNFDSRGRLWVAASPMYPQLKPGEKPNDKVYVLEDIDGDGKADKSTIFAEGLLIPTAVLPDASCNGAYVANSTELLHLVDTDGDGKANQRRIVLSGFGTEDTHHILHTLRYGPDGAIYFNQSIYIHSHVETPWGVKRLAGSGIWRFRPESMQLEVFMRGLINPWGHIFTPWGTSFATDGAGGEGVNYIFPGSVHVTAVGAVRTIRGLNPGQPKHCGLEIASGRHLPPEWDGTLITNDFRGNRINRFALSEEGSGFISRQLPDLVTTQHIAFRPIDVKMGPDGAIYVADWYNPIIQHGEVDFRDPRRDHGHGRIWRITAKGRPLVQRPQLVGASVEQLLDSLKAPEGWTRSHAKLQLQARGAEAVRPALDSWVARLDRNRSDFEHDRLEALWVHQGLGLPNRELLGAISASPDPNARAAAVRVLAEWGASGSGAAGGLPASAGRPVRADTGRQAASGILTTSDAISLLEKAVSDPHPRVRLEAVNSLRALGTPQAMQIAARALDRDVDPYIDFALWLTARQLAPKWLPEFQAGRLNFDGKVSHVAFALKAVENPAALTPLVELLRQGKVDPADRPGTLALIGDIGAPDALQVIFDHALSSFADRGAALQALVKAAAQRGARPPGDLARLAQLLESPDEPTRIAVLRLAGLWKVAPLKPRLVELAAADSASDALRAAAVEGLAAYPAADELTALTAAERPTKVRAAAAAGLVSIDAKSAAPRAVEVLAALSSEADAAPIFESFLRQKEGPVLLTKALSEAKLPSPIAAAGLRRLSSSGRQAPALSAALTRVGGLGQMVQQLSPDEMNKLVSEVRESGDPRRGEAIFRRGNLQCFVCHSIAAGGGKVGPDLVSLGASAPVDYIIESILEPSRKIKEGYHMTVITTRDGQVIAGGLIKETDRDLVIRDVTDRQITIPAANVTKKEIVPASLMPPGLTLTLRRDEFVDLVRFLSELGKDGPLKAPPNRFVRGWQVLIGSPQVGRRMAESSVAIITTDSADLQWKPAYSTVAGDLPVAELPLSRRWESDFGALRFALEVTTPGKIALRFNDPAGLQLWRGQNIVNIEPLTVLELPKGVHTLSLAVNVTQRTAPVRIEVVDLAESAGQAQPVTP